MRLILLYAQKCAVYSDFRRKDIVLGHIGNYVMAKNSAYLLKILQKTREKLPNAKLLLIGDGPDRLAVEAQAKEMQAI